MKTWLKSILGGAIGAAGMILAVRLLSPSQTLRWIEDHQGLAAWVQAIFSVVAILVAAKLVRLERLSHEVSTMASFQGVIWTANDIIQQLNAAIDAQAENRSHTRDFPAEQLAQAKQILADFPTAELGSRRAASVLLSMRALLSQAEHALQIERQFPAGTKPTPRSKKIAAESAAILAEVERWLSNRTKRRNDWWLT